MAELPVVESQPTKKEVGPPAVGAEAFRRSLAELRTPDELRNLLPALLLSAAAVTGARSVGLFERDESRGTVRMVAFVRDGERGDLQADPRLIPWTEPAPFDETPAAAWFTRGVPFWIDNEDPPAEHWADAVPWHRMMGHRWIGAYPLLTRGSLLGFIGFCFPDGPRPPDEPVARCASMADYAALALRLARLTEQAALAARLEEQHAAAVAHAAELAAANDALHHAASRLVRNEDVQGFLESMLLASCDACGAVSAAAFTHDPTDDTLSMTAFVREGRVMDVQRDELLRIWRTRFPAAGDEGWRRMCAGEVFWMDLADPPPELWPESRPWHAEMQHRRIVTVGMFAGPAAVGFFGLGFRGLEPGTNAKIEQVRALAQMAAIALQFQRLAGESVRAARAEEREAAANARAEQLQLTTLALQESIDVLTRLDRTDDFIPAVLGIVARTFGAENCAYFEQRDDGMVFLRNYFVEGRALTPEQFSEVRADNSGFVRMLTEGFTVPVQYLGTTPQDRTRAIVLDHAQGTAVPEFDEFALRNNWGVELNVPLVADGKARGALVIYRRTGSTFTPEEIALGETLAKQLSFAMQSAAVAQREQGAALERQQAAIAREIHDDLAQAFTGILLQSEAGEMLLESGDDRWRECWIKVKRMARFGLAEARRTALALTPALIEEGGLLPVLSQLAQRSNVEGLFDCHFRYSGLPRRLDPAVEKQLVRVTKEALSNAARHGRATRVDIAVAFADNALHLSVQDNGIGLRGEEGDPKPGLGLRNIRSAIESYGGDFHLASDPGLGVTLEVRIPLESAERQISPRRGNA